MKTYFKIFVDVFLITANIVVNAQTVPVLSSASNQRGNTYYFSSDGNNNNDGLSKVTPKQFVTGEFISGLNSGDKALFKCGDMWYDESITWDFSNIRGSAESPIYFGAYGTGEAPVIAKLRLVTDKWQGDGTDVWSVPWNVTQAKTYMLYIDDKIVAPALNGGSVATMDNETYFVSDGRLYLKGFGNPTGRQVEVNTSAGGTFIVFQNSEFITFENIHFKGTSQRSNFINGIAPTSNLVFRNLAIMHIGGYLSVFNTNGLDNHIDHLWENNVIDRTWGPTVYRAMRNNGLSNSAVITTDAICYRNSGEGIAIRYNTFNNWGHTTVNFHQLNPPADMPDIRFNIIEHNVFIPGYAEYNRAFEFSGDARLNYNIFRYNYVYGHTTGSHFMGVNNIAFGNIFDTMVLTTADTNTKAPHHLFVGPWTGDNVVRLSDRNIIMHNTFFNGRENIRVIPSQQNGNNLIINNIFHTWWGADTETDSPGLLIENTRELQTVINNVFWNGPGTDKEGRFSITHRENRLTVAEANNLPNMSGNIAADPQFTSVVREYGASNFQLQTTSPVLNEGFPIENISEVEFPAIRLIKERYEDKYGNPFMPSAPTIGAVSRPYSNLKIN